MPLVRLSFASSRPAAERRVIADAAHAALHAAIGVPAADRFQILETTAELIADPQFLGVQRDDGVIFIEIHLSTGRSVEKKQALYREIAARLAEVGVEPRNIFIHLIETTLENWSFGEGLAQYVLAPPAHLASPGAAPRAIGA